MIGTQVKLDMNAMKIINKNCDFILYYALFSLLLQSL